MIIPSDEKLKRLRELEEESPHLKGMDEISAWMRIDERLVRRLINQGDLKVKKVFGQWRATKQQLDKFIESVQ